MRKNKLTSMERILIISISFTFALLIFRIIYSGTLTYIFFAWNLFLAVIPFLFSRKLKYYQQFSKTVFFLITGWLLFLPNAPYVVTDIFHFRERFPVPLWYDLLIVISAAWNGLCLGFISLMHVEQFLSKLMNRMKVDMLMSCFIFLCGYGIYIGRYMRYNSWDIVSDPFELVSASADHFLNPIQHFRVWEFTVLFSVMLNIIYFTLKHLPLHVRYATEK